jgi:hypothetical protein
VAGEDFQRRIEDALPPGAAPLLNSCHVRCLS